MRAERVPATEVDMDRWRWTSAVALAAGVVGVMMVGDSMHMAGSAPGTDDEPARAGSISAVTPPRAGEPAADAGGGEDTKWVRVRQARVVAEGLAPICGTATGGTVTFPLFDDTVVKAVEESRSEVDGQLVWSGKVPGTVDEDVVVTLHGGCDRPRGDEEFSAQFTLGGDTYAIEPGEPGVVTIGQLTPFSDEDGTAPGEPAAGA
ncbi:hypothetical protein ABT160_15700 [Streptomyces sp. NPDC001941]|uniref:hypothetical protein n=1 Tax=Streptomyces sp. NPDC001941 TaxID=3154659 RepID=UPI00331AB3C5